MRLDTIRQSDSHVNVTDSIECYQHGKIWDCECGQSMWGYYHTKAKKCPACACVNVDRKQEEREPPKVDDGQMTLGNF